MIFQEISIYHVWEGTKAEHLSPGQWEREVAGPVMAVDRV